MRTVIIAVNFGDAMRIGFRQGRRDALCVTPDSAKQRLAGVHAPVHILTDDRMQPIVRLARADGVMIVQTEFKKLGFWYRLKAAFTGDLGWRVW